MKKFKRALLMIRVYLSPRIMWLGIRCLWSGLLVLISDLALILWKALSILVIGKDAMERMLAENERVNR